jgi:hypothetical protein
MGYIEKRPGESGYRARYRDPLGHQHSRTFVRKADAQRFLLEMEADKARGSWIDPRGADMPLSAWVEEFLKLARRLSPTTVQTYRRDLDRYVLPRFGAYRIGRLPADGGGTTDRHSNLRCRLRPPATARSNPAAVRCRPRRRRRRRGTRPAAGGSSPASGLRQSW